MAEDIFINFKKLKLASELSQECLRFITPEELIDLAKDGICPHYELINTKTGAVTYFFISSEVRDWILETYVKYKPSLFVPRYNFIVSSETSCNNRLPPKELSSIPNLHYLSVGETYMLPGIYFLCLKEKIQYIGQSVSVVMRIGSHVLQCQKDFDSIYYINCAKNDLDNFEQALIKHYQPPLNGTLKSLKSQTDKHKDIIQNIIKQE